ncbi:MAG: hypothetical protein JXB49_11070 [Bacteroidales bacterium]|nr:hypothetical protein [Bacteroidales bacterium]
MLNFEYKRYLLFLIISVSLIYQKTYSQKNEFKVINWYKYEKNDGIITKVKYVKEQQTYTKDDLLIRLVGFSNKPSAIIYYSWYFYNSKILTGEERYDASDRLVVAVKYQYNTDGQKLGSEQFKVNENDELYPFMNETFTYDENGKLIMESGKYINGGKAYTKKYKYDEKGTIISFKCKKAEPTVPCDYLMYKIKPVYDDKNRIISASRIEKTPDGITQKMQEQWEYNPKGYLRKITKDVTIKKIHIRRIELYRDGYVVERSDYNENGDIINKEEYTYQIHKVNQTMPTPKYLKF